MINDTAKMETTILGVNEFSMTLIENHINNNETRVSRGAVHSAARSSYAAVRMVMMVAGSCPVLIIA